MATRGGESVSSGSEFELKFYDTESGKNLQLDVTNFVTQLTSFGRVVQKALDQISQIANVSNFELSEFTISAEVGASFLFIKADGSIQLKWTKPKP
jgi:hypothetical protein